ncbi:universal stress protein [Gordonia hankookensis]|uniref:Universal stress protein n=1 Tax=Gordonia hankookensis TaxID=589403 RepID=A0ABR7WF06_9ACTN|nr:universal stress protein [Gordonia hankookensis]MBD1320953.1 universal stress protein [Gordonia hankookensis]
MSTDPTPRLAVGYLATPSGLDGIALAVVIARATGAAIDLICVVRPVGHDGQPGLREYQERLENQAAQWLADGAEHIPPGIETRTVVAVDDSFADGLIGMAQRSKAAMIVVGGADDGLLRRHSLGTVSTGLLHSSPLPVALAPRGYSDNAAAQLDSITVAVSSKPGRSDPLPFAVAMAENAGLDLRLLSLVSLDSPFDDETSRAARELQVATARALLDKTRATVTGDLEVDVLVADGATLDEALDNLPWDDGDVVAIGSGHLGAARRVFLGSTAARILRWTTAPVIVVPRSG